MREPLIRHRTGKRAGFRWRGGEITRIEGLSDAVFAFAVTLLIVSLEVPKTFDELSVTMRGFAAFAICFILLINVWYEQYLYFRRYNLQDTWTLVLNFALLFLVLFYVYPLKFLFTLLVNAWLGFPAEVRMIERHQMPALMAVFSAGYIAVTGMFALVFHHAIRKRDELELNEVELFDTRTSRSASLMNASVGAVSLAIALAAGPAGAGWAGIVYPILLAPGLTVFHTLRGRRRRGLERAARSAAAQPD